MRGLTGGTGPALRESAGREPVSAAAAAEDAVRLAQAAPTRARALAANAAQAARAEGDGAAGSVAERALGLVALSLHELDTAAAHLRRAVRLAQDAGDVLRVGQARMSLALALGHQGRTAAALAEADRARAVLHGVDGARAEMQRALILQHAGRLDEALDGYRRALPPLRRSGDTLWEARLLCNRGVLQIYRGTLGGAEADLRRAETLCLEQGQALMSAGVRQNLGVVAARRGDLPGALAWFDRAEAAFRACAEPLPTLLLDRAELLLSARLVDEARRTAERAVTECAAAGTKVTLAEARLLLAQAALLDGDPAAALPAATTAAAEFRRQRRPSWAVLARHWAQQARLAGGGGRPVTAAAARRVAAELAAAGWPAAALDARISAARLALARGDVAGAADDLALAGAARRRGPVDLRTRAWYAEALFRQALGDRPRAHRAVSVGLRILEEHRATLGATDLRAHASAHRVELARLGVRLALEDGAPAKVLQRAEQTRAGVLHMPTARPPEDPVLADRLAELRGVAVAVQEADPREAPRLRARQAALEQAVRDHCRQAGGTGAVGSVVGARALGAALEDRALVEYVHDGGALHAVVVVDGRLRLRAVGGPGLLDTVAAELRLLPSALRRLATGHGNEASLAAAASAVRFAGARLDAALLAPLANLVGDRALVVAPTGALTGVPWSILPSCRGRSVSVTPSATAWYQARRSRSAPSSAVLVAGPDLPCGQQEVQALAGDYVAPVVLHGAAATVEAVTRHLDGAGLAHVAAHGTFRTDNPLFSSLRLADGPLTVYDLERLGRAPARVVLSACDSGRSALRAGDELLGLAAAFLTMGTALLVAPIVPVPDAETTPLMLDLHAGMRSGRSPAEALARAQERAARGGPGAVAAAAAFLALGAG